MHDPGSHPVVPVQGLFTMQGRVRCTCMEAQYACGCNIMSALPPSAITVFHLLVALSRAAQCAMVRFAGAPAPLSLA